jgi:hypothetical protein
MAMRARQDLTREALIEAIRRNAPALARRYGVSKIGLFGSFAQGVPTPASDVDLVIEFNRPIGLAFVELADDFEQLLGRSVDLLTQDGIRNIRVPVVQDRIVSSIEYVWPN